MRALRMFVLTLLMPCMVLLGTTPTAQAQSTDERFQDLFVTAGYTTAFGAALGTALLAFTPAPSENLRFVYIGASLGFIGGSILGSYVIFAPMLGDGQSLDTPSLADGRLPDQGVVVRPTWDPSTSKFSAIESGMTLARF